MKFSSLFVTIGAAKKPDQQLSEISKSIGNITCGESLFDFEEGSIQSPGYPENYVNDLGCTWFLENECAESYTITPTNFSLEFNSHCSYDRLTFDSLDGDSSTYIFCGDETTSDFNYDYYGDLFHTNGMDGSFTILGSELQILFTTDDVVVRTGFDIQIVANLRQGCVPGARPEEVCLAERGSEKYSNLAYWETTTTYDKPVPFSNYSTDLNFDSSFFELQCIEKCIETAGCFKIKADGSADDNCMLRGNELTPDDSKTFAINGRTCDEDDARAWIDGRSLTRQYCYFCNIGEAYRFLNDLNGNNPELLEWSSRNSSTVNNQIVSSSKWGFFIAEDRSPDLTASCIWYKFESRTYFRTFLPNNIVDTRVRRDAEDDSAALFQAITQESAEAFVNDLDIGDSGATVVQTDAPEITVEIVEEVATPQDFEFAAAFSAVENIITESITNLPNERQS
ncbi:unnamed protein product [Oikopleura dioica]|uniref:CUB domain-containing protein n=1 Tax=Oikopleura dioica TaxID=34765 RepID=E4X5V7_OIKDI|nr:unnamed protein product [Oikopleura dioica]